MKTIDTLISDIYDLFDSDVLVDEEALNEFAESLKDTIRTRLKKRQEPKGDSVLRFSAIGKPSRQLWYAAKGYPKEEMTKETHLKFLFGDMYEAILILLVKLAGHSVGYEQGEVDCLGVKGHIDCIIDGHVVDVKSASPFGFKKFVDGDLLQGQDPFGYIPQISGYENMLKTGKSPYFFAVEKVMGKLALLEVPSYLVEENEPSLRIKELRDVINEDDPPSRCYSDVPDGKSGNRKLDTGCSYCAYKHSCWDLRTFIYSTGPRYLTRVSKEPNVPEITN